ncbi:MAG TPA: hypothetical protein VKG24_19735 [Pseudolabrys sp.]|nr:hypothetical protein [Pseudolabrys sp.]
MHPKKRYALFIIFVEAISMPRETQKPSEMLPQDKPSSRRDLLTGALLGLGASVLVQANGGVAHAKNQSPSQSGTNRKVTREKKT